MLKAKTKLANLTVHLTGRLLTKSSTWESHKVVFFLHDLKVLSNQTRLIPMLTFLYFTGLHSKTKRNKDPIMLTPTPVTAYRRFDAEY